MTAVVPAPPQAEEDAGAAIEAAAERLIAAGEGNPVAARDPVNTATIRNWTDALQDRNPIYTDPATASSSVHGGLVAPPAMLQVWTMPGLAPAPPDASENPLSAMLAVLDEHGFTSVVATNCEQTYDRYLRPGELLTSTVRVESVQGPKRTGLGEGYFVTARFTWRVDDEPVGRMLFRILKFRPPAAPGAGESPATARVSGPPAEAGSGESPAAPAAPPAAVELPSQAPQFNRSLDGGYPLQPVISRDTAFFWAGLKAGELRIQSCGGCGALRHPPGPLCPRCHSTDRGHVLASGRGDIYSYVVHHHPPVPGRTVPFVVAVVALPEGVRMVGNVLAEPGQVRIGAAVTVEFERVDENLVLPSWRLSDAQGAP